MQRLTWRDDKFGMAQAPANPRRRLRLAAVLTGCCLMVGDPVLAEEAGPLPPSPANLLGLFNRQRPWPPQPWFTEEELNVMATRFEAMGGPDGHGYDFPGAIDEVRAINPNIIALTHWEAMGVQAAGWRMGAVDLEEDVFIHSADPASLTAVIHDGHTVLWFLQDARNRDMSPHYDPPGVSEYLIEAAPWEGGPFSPIGDPVPDAGYGYYRVEDDVVDPNRVYRVRSRLLSGDLVDYSWTVSPDPDAVAALAVGRLFLDGSMIALCYGACPEDPSGLRIDADLDNDHVYEPGESFFFDSVESYADGGWLYGGTATHPSLEELYGHRIVVVDSPDVRAPLQGSYQTGVYNNRIQMRCCSSYLVWPSHATWVQLVEQRLSDALAVGYNGMRLDFTLDTLQQHWAATGLLPDWTGPDDPRIADAMEELLVALAAHEPDAILTINGYFAVHDPANYFRYLAYVDGGDFEFFGIGHQSQSPELQANTGEAFEAIWQTRAADRWAIACSGAALENLEGRLKVFALYLLLFGDGVFFYNETDSSCQDVVYFPEWGVPLGEPLYPVDDWDDLADPRDELILAREFESGWVFYSYNPEQVTIALDETLYRLSVTGGFSTLLGGDGEAHYTPVDNITFNPDEVAILVRTPPGQENPVPVMSGWGMISMTILICVAGGWVVTQRHRAERGVTAHDEGVHNGSPRTK